MNTDLELKIAKMLNGPFNLNEFLDDKQLYELREVKWDMLSTQEKGMFLQQAKVIVKEVVQGGS